ncbi:MAG: LapA family protein [Bacteroidales bacterium]|nr:LapA family protein [Bacteroidales bacterium]
MKTFKTILVIILVIIALFFAFQNFQTVNISFYKWSAEIPLSLAIIGIYVFGALTGGILFSVLKKIVRLDKNIN